MNDGSGSTMTDSSGNGNDLTIYGTPTWTSGVDGGALLFDGSTNYAHINTFNNTPASTMSLCVWFKTSATDQVLMTFSRTLASHNNEGVFQIDQSGKLNFWDYGVGQYGFSSADSARVVSDNHWHLGCFVKDGTSGTYYIDGVQNGTSTAGTDVTYGNNDWTVGKDYRDGGMLFNGTLDDFRIYNRALSADEVSGLYGLTAFWKFDDASGTSAVDSSGNNNTGTLHSSPVWTTGEISGALNFTTTNYVTAPGAGISSSTVSTGKVAAAAWVYLNSAAPWGTIVKNWPEDSSNNQFHFGLQESTGNLSVYIEQSNGTVIGPVTDPNPLPLNTWVHVAFSADGSTVMLYKNAVAVASTSYDGTLHAGGNYVGIGVKTNNDGTAAPEIPGYFDGTIDELHLFNRGITADDIQNMMEIVPHKVQNLSVTGTYASGFNLTWNANDPLDNVTDYEILTSIDGGNFWNTTDTASTSTSYVLTGQAPGTVLFKVFATNSVGTGDSSDSVSISSPVLSYNIGSSCTDLENLATRPGDAYGHYTMTADIDCTDVDFQPISFGGPGFQGVFDGAGHTISNLTMNQSDNANIGLFSYVTGASISDLNFRGGYVNAYGAGGVLAGDMYNSIIDNVTSDISVTGNNDGSYVTGGLIGYMQNSTTTNSWSTGDVSGVNYLGGGLVGEADHSYISYSHATGNVTAIPYAAGGLVGYVYDSTIDHSYATGNVTGDQSVGGLVGDASDSGGLVVSQSFASSTVSGGQQVGGLVGYLSPNGDFPATITDSYAIGNVNANNGVDDSDVNFGGIVGDASNAEIFNSYFAGTISGVNNLGGAVGNLSSSSLYNTFTVPVLTYNSNPVGAVVGTGDATGFNGNPEFNNVVYEASSYGGCDGNYDGPPDGCTFVGTGEIPDPQYFINTASVAPFATSTQVWDFTNTWKTHSNTYPTLRGVREATIVSLEI
jgi:Concanavalin A-like lectin/glucanases superfamily/The GLUG motif